MYFFNINTRTQQRWKCIYKFTASLEHCPLLIKKTAMRKRQNEEANLRTLSSEDRVIKDFLIKNQTGYNY